MTVSKINELIDSGFVVLGTAPEQEVLFELMERILQARSCQRLYDLLGSKNKVEVCFYHKKRPGEEVKHDGFYSPRSNRISISINRVRSFEARISTLTHELFHALQYKTGTLHRGFTSDEGKQVFMLNELEARFKSMEILSELYPDANYALMDINHTTKIDCIIYRALQEQAQKALMGAGQKSSLLAKKISRRLAKAEMLKSQLNSVTNHVSEVLGRNWSNEFEDINKEWQECYSLNSKDCGDLTSIIPFLQFKTKPNFLEIQKMISNRLEIPVDVLQEVEKAPQNKPQKDKTSSVSKLFQKKINTH